MFLASWKQYFSDDSIACGQIPPWFQTFHGWHYLKREYKACIIGTRPHLAPSFFLTYLFSKIPCAPNSHLWIYFWPKNMLLYFGVPLAISFVLDSDHRPHFGIFWDLLWKEQDSHTQSDEGRFCCKCQNSTQRCFLCGQCRINTGFQWNPRASPAHKPFTGQGRDLWIWPPISMLHFSKARL